MKLIKQRLRARRGDAGMTLIEIIVAISIMAIIATAAVSISLASLSSAATQQRQELAVTIANKAMEAASAQSPVVRAARPDEDGETESTAVSPLYQGRSETNVLGSWAANANFNDVVGLDSTYPRWDPDAIDEQAPAIPIASVVNREDFNTHTEFAVHTLIGDCYQPTSGGSCTQLTDGDVAPMIRVMVIVRWSAGAGCSENRCSYQATTLFDPHEDLEWNTNE